MDALLGKLFAELLQNICHVLLSHFNTACGERTPVSLQLRAKVHYFSPRSEETCSPIPLLSNALSVWLFSWVIGHGFN